LGNKTRSDLRANLAMLPVAITVADYSHSPFPVTHQAVGILIIFCRHAMAAPDH
jgi:hypothetical protein